MVILGLDPGTALLGWGVIEAAGPRHTSRGYGVVSTDKSMSHSKRLLAVAGGIESLLDEHKPDLVAVERLFFSRNITTAMTVSEARGVLLYVAERMGYRVVELTPQEVKVAVAGNGRADKKEVQRMVQLLLKLPEVPKPDDAADAVAVAITAALTESFGTRAGRGRG